MDPSLAFPPSYYLILGLLCGAVGFRLGWRARNRFVLPLAQGLLGWVGAFYAWRSFGPAMAAAALGCWALATTFVSLYFFLGQPRETEERVLRAAAYREGMLEGLRTGRGPDSPPLATVRAHVHEFVVYLAAATLTANLASLVLGAVLLNMMNAWVATLLRAARRTGGVVLLGWPVWSVVRVAAYIAIGTAAAAPLAARLGYPAPPGTVLPLAVLGGAGIVVDLVLKLLLSAPCSRRLAEAVDLEAAAANRRRDDPLRIGLDEPGAGPGSGDPTGR